LPQKVGSIDQKNSNGCPEINPQDQLLLLNQKFIDFLNVDLSREINQKIARSTTKQTQK
jgi:hypothetical protein